jgi:hypothetical protein
MKTRITSRKFIHQAAIVAAGIGVTTAMEPMKSFAKAATTA